ncbi:MAG: bacillithiol biosynthesis cysteine-adding enzyme BshC [Lacibacter sp.]
MDCTAHYFSYAATGAFSRLVTDYLEGKATVRPFYEAPPTPEGIRQQMELRKAYPTNRELLVRVLEQQYRSVPQHDAVQQNIGRLLHANCFTVTTAHQPNLFTGPLYFIYKILHTIRLAEWLGRQFPEAEFVPVFYIGTEDADFDELSYCNVNNTRLQWNTDQSGAFGRMILDANSEALLQQLEGMLGVEPHGPALLHLLRTSYAAGTSVQQATFAFVHALFAKWGLVVLLPEHADLKRMMVPVFRDELLHQRSHQLVSETVAQLGRQYKIQAGSRPINIFYLDEDLRERIERQGDEYNVVNSDIRFSETALLEELEQHPERFSPNVILRGLYQELLLPNLAFVGGGGELAYWLELKNVFQHYGVPYPVLVLRNSYLLLPQVDAQRFEKWGYDLAAIFRPADQLLHDFVQRHSKNRLHLGPEREAIKAQYASLEKVAGAIDVTLQPHVRALYAQAEKRLHELEKKMVRAEKRKHADVQRRLQTFKAQYFPGNGLQERSESMLGYYAKWGSAFLDQLYRHALTLEQQFTVLLYS